MGGSRVEATTAWERLRGCARRPGLPAAPRDGRVPPELARLGRAGAGGGWEMKIWFAQGTGAAMGAALGAAYGGLLLALVSTAGPCGSRSASTRASASRPCGPRGWPAFPIFRLPRPYALTVLGHAPMPQHEPAASLIALSSSKPCCGLTGLTPPSSRPPGPPGQQSIAPDGSSARRMALRRRHSTEQSEASEHAGRCRECWRWNRRARIDEAP